MKLNPQGDSQTIAKKFLILYKPYYHQEHNQFKMSSKIELEPPNHHLEITIKFHETVSVKIITITKSNETV